MKRTAPYIPSSYSQNHCENSSTETTLYRNKSVVNRRLNKKAGRVVTVGVGTIIVNPGKRIAKPVASQATEDSGSGSEESFDENVNAPNAEDDSDDVDDGNEDSGGDDFDNAEDEADLDAEIEADMGIWCWMKNTSKMSKHLFLGIQWRLMHSKWIWMIIASPAASILLLARVD